MVEEEEGSCRGGKSTKLESNNNKNNNLGRKPIIIRVKWNSRKQTTTHLHKTTRQLSKGINKVLKMKAKAQGIKRKLSGNSNHKIRDVWE